MTDAKTHLTEIIRELGRLPRYRTKEIAILLISFAFLILSTGQYTKMWIRGWEQQRAGITWHLMKFFAAFLSVPEPTVFLFLPAFMVGMASVVWFDTVKRPQGALLLVGGVVALFTSLGLGEFPTEWVQLDVIGILLAAFVLGLVSAGLVGEFRTKGPNEFSTGFDRLGKLVVVLGAIGFFEAHVDYLSPFTFEGGLGLPHYYGFSGVSQTGGLDIAAILILYYAIGTFTDYELTKDILILGPKRAGKTWLMTGIAYCLKAQAVKSKRAGSPRLSDDLGEFYRKFNERDFDQIGATEGVETNRFKLSYLHGAFFRRRVTIDTLDHSGELLMDIDPEIADSDVSRPDHLSESGVATDGGSVSEAEENEAGEDDQGTDEVDYLDDEVEQSGSRMSADEIVNRLSWRVEDADTIAFVLPMDDFVNPEEVELPVHLQPDDFGATDRPPRAKYLRKYDTIAREQREDTDFLFIATMSDVLIGEFDGNPRTDWESFRELVWYYASMVDQKQNFDPADPLEIEIGEDAPVGPVRPVYFQPDQDDPRTDAGNIKPRLHWANDTRYALRGLKELLGRLGR